MKQDGEIFVRREGSGPEVVLVHGGASPERTWAALGELAARWTLVIPYRRGYEPSPPGRHDFELDAADLASLLGAGAHLVTHSYGGLGALIAAGREPGLVRSLTLIETPLFCVAPEDPEVAELQRLGDEFLLRGLEAEPRGLREFLAIAGAEGLTEEGPLPARVARAVRRSQGGRSPGEARPDLGALREAGVPALVASGGHSEAQERICDRLAEELGAQREVFWGAGHFVQEAPGFGARLEGHLKAAEDRRRRALR
jgi:pimeloyl-ACP methyl ester carboxylesterase